MAKVGYNTDQNIKVICHWTFQVQTLDLSESLCSLDVKQHVDVSYLVSSDRQKFHVDLKLLGTNCRDS